MSSGSERENAHTRRLTEMIFARARRDGLVGMIVGQLVAGRQRGAG